MLKQWHLAPVVAILMAVMMFVISACGGNTTTGGNGAGSTPSGSGGSTVGTPGAYNCVQGTLNLSGSTALAPLVQAVAADYQKKCSGASITVGLGGSGTGLSQVESGGVQIGNSDLFKKSGQADLIDHQVAVVIFTIIINSKVTGVTNLTTDQLKSIYSGQTTNWNQVGGPDLKIVVISRPTSSGTRGTFQNYILGGPEKISGPQSLTTDSTGTVIKNVEQTSGSIGYAASAPARKAGSALTIVNIDGQAPTADLVKNNTYKFWNIEHMYTKGPATGLAQALIDYMGSSDGKAEATKLDFLLTTDLTADAIQAHQPKS
ncbi:MAG: phosphate ABC transporter substrate-binding protein [Ktedonobacteraceae bacterium]